MLKFVQGNFFDYDADIRVNTVNCVGVMGAGVALAFKNKYPAMFNEYVNECLLGKVKPGMPYAWKDSEIFNSITIINFPTKNNWRNPSEYSYIENGLIWLEKYLRNKKDSTVTLPALGCGHGGLNWDIVKDMIINQLQHLEANILVFEPKSSTNIPNEDNIEEELRQSSIVKISPDHISYPERLKGRSAKDIFIKGNKDILNQKLLSIVVDSKAEEREKEAINNCIKAFSNHNLTYLLAYNSSFEIDVLKQILYNSPKAVVIIIPFGILQFKLRNDLKDIWNINKDKITIISIAKPKDSWKASESINTLKIRFQISHTTLISNYNYTGLEKLQKDITKSSNRIFYLNYWDKHIDFFSQIHATKIGKRKEDNMPNITPIFSR